jgi:carbamoyltransferase
VVDGQLGARQRHSIDLFGEICFPHSLGLLYTAFTSYLGFKVNSAEYKVMGLAPYGVARFERELRELIEVADDGSFRLNMKYFAYHHGLEMTSERFHRLFGGPPREPEGPLEQRHRDVAARRTSFRSRRSCSMPSRPSIV